MLLQCDKNLSTLFTQTGKLRQTVNCMYLNSCIWVLHYLQLYFTASSLHLSHCLSGPVCWVVSPLTWTWCSCLQVQVKIIFSRDHWVLVKGFFNLPSFSAHHLAPLSTQNPSWYTGGQVYQPRWTPSPCLHSEDSNNVSYLRQLLWGSQKVIKPLTKININ